MGIVMWYQQNSKRVKYRYGVVRYHQNRKVIKYATVPENIFSWGGIKIRDKVPVDGFPNFGYRGMKLPKQSQLKKCKMGRDTVHRTSLAWVPRNRYGTGTEKVPGTTTGKYLPVLRIHDILVWILFRGAMPLIKGTVAPD